MTTLLIQVLEQNHAQRKRRKVLKAWSHEDSWGVQTINVDTALELLGLLDDGTEPTALVEHAKHTGTHCCQLDKII